jgi:hypothetical protein
MWTPNDLRRVKEAKCPEFITGYERYAVKAFFGPCIPRRRSTGVGVVGNGGGDVFGAEKYIILHGEQKFVNGPAVDSVVEFKNRDFHESGEMHMMQTSKRWALNQARR